MVLKGVLEIIPNPGPGFYSRLFLVEKASGGWHPVIDLSPLNEFIQQTPFRMETPSSVLLTVRKNDFLASIDLRDAYFQIPVHLSSSKLLRFVSNDTVYQFKALCFGLPTAPQVFTRVFATVSSWAHARGIRLLRYLDDWLILSPSERKTRQHVNQLLSLCRSLGIVVNTEKSDLCPSRSVEYLGMVIDTVSARAVPTEARIQKFLSLARKFLAQPSPPARQWQVLLGHLSSLEKLVPCARLRMRSLQWQLKASLSTECDPPHLLVPRSQQVDSDVLWWMLKDHLLPGQSNVLADLLSRRDQVLAAEWSLLPQVAKKIIRTWGSPTIGLFATHLNAKLPLYCSLIPDPQGVFEDAFCHPWNHLDVYAFPPFGLVDKVVARVRETPNLSMTLIAPLWPEKAWFADLLLLLTQSPLTMPLWDRLLR